MPKRVYIIHSWGSNPGKDWLPWARKELENKGFEVFIPEMPNSDEPKIELWTSHLKSINQNPDKNDYFVGHSIGCQTILRYLEAQPLNIKVGGVILVAPWLILTGLETEEEKEVARPWLDNTIDFTMVKGHSNFVCIFSDDDPFVPMENEGLFRERLDAKTVVTYGQGHFREEDGIKELPVVLEELLKNKN